VAREGRPKPTLGSELTLPNERMLNRGGVGNSKRVKEKNEETGRGQWKKLREEGLDKEKGKFWSERRSKGRHVWLTVREKGFIEQKGREEDVTSRNIEKKRRYNK